MQHWEYAIGKHEKWLQQFNQPDILLEWLDWDIGRNPGVRMPFKHLMEASQKKFDILFEKLGKKTDPEFKD